MVKTNEAQLKAVKKYQQKIKEDPEKLTQHQRKRKEYMRSYRANKVDDIDELQLRIDILKLKSKNLDN